MSGPGFELKKALLALRARVLWRIAEKSGSTVRERVIVRKVGKLEDMDVLDAAEWPWRWLPRFLRSFKRKKTGGYGRSM